MNKGLLITLFFSFLEKNIEIASKFTDIVLSSA